MIIKAKNLKEDYLEGIAGIIIVIFILINIITATFLVAYGMGIFKRPDANMIIGEYMKENIDNEKYGCVAYNQDKSFTFYTQHICANYKKINVSWLEEQKANNDLKFFVINLYQRNVGIGMETWADIEKYFPEEYAWVMENTVDITENTGLDEDNPYFKLYELKKE